MPIMVLVMPALWRYSKTVLSPRIRLVCFQITASRREIAERIDNLTSDGVKYILSKLQKEGIVKRIGAKFGGHWGIIK